MTDKLSFRCSSLEMIQNLSFDIKNVSHAIPRYTTLHYRFKLLWTSI